MKLPTSILRKLDHHIVEKQEDKKIQEAYDGLDQLHEELVKNPENPPGDSRLRTGAEQARQTPEKAGNGGTVPPKEHRFKPGQSGNPGGRPAGVSLLVRQLLSQNEQELAKQVAKTWIEKACQGKQTALAELLKRADGIPPSRAEREDLFYNLPPGSMARTRKRFAKAMREHPPLWSAVPQLRGEERAE